MIFTTSWDDGRRDDLRLAALLERYGATGTFYVSPPSTHEKPALSESDIRQLSERFEIGAHTMTHPRLTRLPLGDARREIVDSKAWVESITGKLCVVFCYPYGDENMSIRSLVRAAGFAGARTAEQLQHTCGDPFGMPTTLQVYPFPLRRRFTRWWHPLDPFARLRLYFVPLRALGISLVSCMSWLSLAKALFQKIQERETGNAPNAARCHFHLWGHSWEVERYGMWGDLENFLHFVRRQDSVVYTTNGELLAHL